MTTDKGKGSRAIIYGRVSFIARRGGRAATNETSVDRQFAACESYAAVQGWTVVDRAEDRGVSAFKKDVERPGWRKVVEAVESDSVDIVCVSAPDRAGRNIVKLMSFVELCEDNGVRFVTVTGGIDTGSRWSKTILSVMAAIAEMESAIKKERTLARHLEDAQSGRAVGQRFRTFGYTRDMQPVEDEADAIREAVERYLNGASIGSIVDDWNARGLKTTAGGQWTTTTVGRLFDNPAIAGIREHLGKDEHGHKRTRGTGQRYDAAWEPIIPQPTFRRVQDRRGAERERHTFRRSDRYLLTGTLTCGIEGCGHRLVGHPVGGKRRYVCTGSGTSHLGILADAVEEYVIDLCINMRPPITRVRDPRELSKPLLKELESVERKLDDFAENAAEAGFTVSMMRKGSAKLIADRDRIQAELDALAEAPDPDAPTTFVNFASPEDAGEARYTPEMAAFVGSRVESITVMPVGRGGNNPPVADRITIHWREGVLTAEELFRRAAEEKKRTRKGHAR